MCVVTMETIKSHWQHLVGSLLLRSKQPNVVHLSYIVTKFCWSFGPQLCLLTFFRNVLVNNCVFRYMGQSGQPLMSLRPWRSPVVEPKENRVEEDSLSDPTVSPDEPKSEPLPEIPSLLPAENGLKRSKLYRQQSLVILTGRTNTS